MRKVLLTGLCLLAPLFLRAQTLELSERWTMNERLIDLLDNYERFSVFEGRSASYSYSSLFVNESAPVYCDYLTSPDFGKNIPVGEYIRQSMKLADCSVQLSNFRKGRLEHRNGAWHAQVRFEKRVEYEDSLGFTFSTRLSPASGDFTLTMDCVWMDQEEAFRIAAITGPKYESEFPSGKFLIAEQKNQTDTRILANGEPLSFNDYGFTILPSDADFTPDDDDFFLTWEEEPGADRYQLVQFQLIPKRFRTRAHLSLSPFGAYAVTTASDDISASSFGAELGGEIGYALPLSRSFKLAVYTGIGLSLGTISLSAQNVDYSYMGGTNMWSYHITKASESVTLLDAVIPFYLSPEINVSKQISVVADLGAKIYLGMLAQPNTYHVNGTFDDGSGPVLIDQDYSRFLTPNQNQMNQYAITAVGKIGLDFAFQPGMYAYVHAGYEYGLTDSYLPDSLDPWYNKKNEVYPIVHVGGEDVAIRSFLGSMSFKRQGILLEAGIRIKFGNNK